MAEFTERIAKIRTTRLGYEDHGILTVNLDLDYGGSGQGAGGYALDGPPGPENRERRPSVACGAFVAGILRACGVDNWEQVAGRTVIALCDGPNGLVRGIKPLPTEPGEEFLFTDLQLWSEVDLERLRA